MWVTWVWVMSSAPPASVLAHAATTSGKRNLEITFKNNMISTAAAQYVCLLHFQRSCCAVVHESCVAPFPLKGQLSLEIISCQQRAVLQPCCFREPSALITDSLIPGMLLCWRRKAWACVCQLCTHNLLSFLSVRRMCLFNCSQQIRVTKATVRERVRAC